jgi:hypothetical protein
LRNAKSQENAHVGQLAGWWIENANHPQNVNASYRLDQVEFLRSLASRDMGEMSKFL